VDFNKTGTREHIKDGTKRNDRHKRRQKVQQDAQAAKEAAHMAQAAQDAKAAHVAQAAQDAQDAQVAQADKEAQAAQVAQVAQDAQDAQVAQAAKDAQAAKEAKEAQAAKAAQVATEELNARRNDALKLVLPIGGPEGHFFGCPWCGICLEVLPTGCNRITCYGCLNSFCYCCGYMAKDKKEVYDHLEKETQKAMVGGHTLCVLQYCPGIACLACSINNCHKVTRGVTPFFPSFF